MEPTDRFTQPVTVTAVDGTQFRCTVEWVQQPLGSGATQCLAEHWVCRAGDVVCIGPPVGDVASPLDLQQAIQKRLNIAR